MNEQELLQKIAEQDQKIEELSNSIKKIKKIFWTIIIISVIAFVLPLIGLIFVIPSFLSNYSDVLSI